MLQMENEINEQKRSSTCTVLANTTSRQSNLLLGKSKARYFNSTIEVLEFLFFLRTARDWNDFLLQLVLVKSLTLFKDSLRIFKIKQVYILFCAGFYVYI